MFSFEMFVEIFVEDKPVLTALLGAGEGVGLGVVLLEAGPVITHLIVEKTYHFLSSCQSRKSWAGDPHGRMNKRNGGNIYLFMNCISM